MYDSSGDLDILLNGCVAEAKVNYTLGFDPSAAEHADEYHELAAKIAKPGVAAHTNTSYYAEPVPMP